MAIILTSSTDNWIINEYKYIYIYILIVKLKSTLEVENKILLQAFCFKVTLQRYVVFIE